MKNSFINLTGVNTIHPADNENSLILTFWNGASVSVSSNQDIGITNSNEVILWGER